MALPWWMIKDLKVNRVQKFALALLFSVAIVCVAMDIVRTIEAVAEHQALYTILEINLVVIISCLPTYRALLNVFQRHRSRRPSGSSYWKSLEDKGPSKSGQSRSHQSESLDVKGTGSAANVIRVTSSIEIANGRQDHDVLELEPFEHRNGRR